MEQGAIWETNESTRSHTLKLDCVIRKNMESMLKGNCDRWVCPCLCVCVFIRSVCINLGVFSCFYAAGTNIYLSLWPPQPLKHINPQLKMMYVCVCRSVFWQHWWLFSRRLCVFWGFFFSVFRGNSPPKDTPLLIGSLSAGNEES